MKINHNIAAFTTNSQLLRNENALTDSIERLSSGLRINHASDDAAGMAISIKMQAQIDGLDQASRNASDGISVIEIADGALGEVTSMLQRMRELSVQAANETNGLDDREAIQSEIDQLSSEVDRISATTEFNQKVLLDGSLNRRVYTDNSKVNVTSVTDNVASKEYEITVKQDARQAVFVSEPITDTSTYLDGSDKINAATAGTVTVNGVEISIEEGDTAVQVYEKLRDGCELADVNCAIIKSSATAKTDGKNETTAGYAPDTASYDYVNNKLVFASDEYGRETTMEIKCSNENLKDLLGLGNSNIKVAGTNAVVELKDNAGFSTTATVSTNGNEVSITDKDGFSMSLTLDVGVCTTVYKDVTGLDTGVATDTLVAMRQSSTDANVSISATNIGTMTLQIGANEGQSLEIDIPDTSCASLKIDDLNVKSTNGADKALVKLDNAIATVSAVRSKLGAYENRLEHAVTNLDSSGQNLTSAISRIEDIDMAEEMTNYTNYNVLTQAATSVLAQANDLPQQVLQLLQ